MRHACGINSLTPARETPMSPQSGRREKCDGRIDAKELLALLGRDLQQVEEQLAAVGVSVASPLTDTVAEAAEELRASVSAFLEKAHAATDAVGERAKENAEALHEQMGKHPLATASSAFALGYFLGRTVFGRKHANS
jgi:hypothetical protein